MWCVGNSLLDSSNKLKLYSKVAVERFKVVNSFTYSYDLIIRNIKIVLIVILFVGVIYFAHKYKWNSRLKQIIRNRFSNDYSFRESE